ncbi:juxtaposed with another zinc finger protein 1-like isoform X1 [Ylistrum balloti]|uniref:juxtaposed with another zinc finger protein 1-like isoform X1 n=1 Tax=Ylistrum balloti TaxID=509963 RepID=UPI002905E98F|nr:juxtaposed with another zinc finger protein 1-like isoform X1 [Ylistrum balloti]
MQMAVFLLNNCRFQGCGLQFDTLGDLIQHIEDTHIDSDPQVLEKQETRQPSSLALSYILRCFTNEGRRAQQELNRKQREYYQSPAPTARSVTPSGSEFDDYDSNSEEEDSDAAVSTQEFSAELILSMVNGRESPGDSEKPLACPVPGCTKRYKNINGMKYHAHHAHKKEISQIRKGTTIYNCRYCSKSYKTTNGLRNHMLNQHTPSDVMAIKPVQLTTSSSVFLSSQKALAQHLDKSNNECSASAILSESFDTSCDASFAEDSITPSEFPSPVAIKKVTMPKIIRAGLSFQNSCVTTKSLVTKQKKANSAESMELSPFLIQDHDVSMAMSPEIAVDF